MENFEFAKKICQKLQRNNFKAYFVGGFVRDYLIQKNIKNISLQNFSKKFKTDIDISTNAKSSEIKKIFKNEKFLEVGEKFNICIITKNKINYEIATFRIDGKYDNGRRPKEVFLGNEKEDVLRRDFTINGIMLDPIKNEFIDYVNGLRDIIKKTIRTINNPKERFLEDYLRMLRAIRFSSQLNFRIEKNTFNEIKNNSKKIKEISKERIKSELDKIIFSKEFYNGLKKIFLSNLFENIFFKNKIYEKNILKYLKNLKEKDNENKKILIYSVIFFQLKNINKIGKKLKENKFTNKEISNIIYICENFYLIQKKKLSNQNILEICKNENIENLFLFFDILKIKNKNLNYLKEFFLKLSKKKTKLKNLKKFEIITGNDLIKLNLLKGKLFKSVIDFSKEKYFFENLNKNQILKEIKLKYKNE